MFQEPDISAVAALVGDPTRAIILSALLCGESLPAGELAARAHVTPQTASLHLSKLLDGNLIKVVKSGRHRYYALKSAEVAQVLEALQVIAPPPQQFIHSKHKPSSEMCLVRTCYDHLAGRVSVELCDSLLERGHIFENNQNYHLTEKGESFLCDWGIAVAQLYGKRRRFAYACLDWSERRYHVAGALGAVFTDTFFANGWIKRLPKTRAVQITTAGRQMLRAEFDIRLQP